MALGRFGGRALRRAACTVPRASRFHNSAWEAALERRMTELERVTVQMGGAVYAQGLTLTLLQVHVGYWPELPTPTTANEPGAGVEADAPAKKVPLY
jgi:hypothetical protein